MSERMTYSNLDNGDDLENKSNENEKEKISTLDELREKLPYIKFPADWEIKFYPALKEEQPLNFVVKKEGAPNRISVILTMNWMKPGDTFWETMVSGDYRGSTEHRYKIENIDELLKGIERDFYSVNENYDEDFEEEK